MGKALQGEHYCLKHQGNHSHYAEENCTVCKLATDLETVESNYKRAVRMYAELKTKLVALQEDNRAIALNSAQSDLLQAERINRVLAELEEQRGINEEQSKQLAEMRREYDSLLDENISVAERNLILTSKLTALKEQGSD